MAHYGNRWSLAAHCPVVHGLLSSRGPQSLADKYVKNGDSEAYRFTNEELFLVHYKKTSISCSRVTKHKSWKPEEYFDYYFNLLSEAGNLNDIEKGDVIGTCWPTVVCDSCSDRFVPEFETTQLL